MKLLFTILILISTLFFNLGCSDSKPDKLIEEVLPDDNISKVIPFDTNKSIYVYAYYNDGTKKDITEVLKWSSSKKEIAEVTKDGVVNAKSITGNVDIHYETQEISSDGTPFYVGYITFSVEDLNLLDIELEPSSIQNIFTGDLKNITATGIFEKNETVDITSDCNWTSLDPDIAKVVDKGVVEGKSQGVTKIIVKYKDKNQILDVNVTRVEYSSLTIESTTTDFNVKQTIQLKAKATNDRGEIVDLINSNVTWGSDNEAVITVNPASGLATAVTKGSAVITATIVDTELKSSITLSVIKDKYLRLFKDGIEIKFPHIDAKGYDDLPDEFSTFHLIAVGDDFIISDLNVTDSNGAFVGNASFNNLENEQTISIDTNITFKLINNTNEKELNYHFKIDDDAQNSFDEKYYETAN